MLQRRNDGVRSVQVLESMLEHSSSFTTAITIIFNHTLPMQPYGAFHETIWLPRFKKMLHEHIPEVFHDLFLKYGVVVDFHPEKLGTPEFVSITYPEIDLIEWHDRTLYTLFQQMGDPEAFEYALGEWIRELLETSPEWDNFSQVAANGNGNNMAYKHLGSREEVSQITLEEEEGYNSNSQLKKYRRKIL